MTARAIFVSGTDTGVGKTWFAAGAARALLRGGEDVGVMKPFASGEPDGTPYRSADVRLLMEAARSRERPDQVCPQFFPHPASPFSACKRHGCRVDVRAALDAFERASSGHEVMVVEGIGGVMSPIEAGYGSCDLARDMGLPVAVVVPRMMGAQGQAAAAVQACEARGTRVAGVVIGGAPCPGGYGDELADDLRDMGLRVAGVCGRAKSADPEDLADAAAGALPPLNV